jgi:hypothetical protein
VGVNRLLRSRQFTYQANRAASSSSSTEHAIMANVLEYFAMNGAAGAAETGSVASTVMSVVNNVGTSATGGPSGEQVRDFERDSLQYFTTAVADNSLFDMNDTTKCFSVWCKPETDSAAQGLVSRYVTGTSTREFLYYRASGNKLNTSINDAGQTIRLTGSTGTSILAGSWYLCWFWHDAANDQRGNAVNGEAATTGSHTTGVLTTASDPFRIGWQTSGNLWDGLMGPITYYNTVPDLTTRTLIYNGGLFRPFPYMA